MMQKYDIILSAADFPFGMVLFSQSGFDLTHGSAGFIDRHTV